MEENVTQKKGIGVWVVLGVLGLVVVAGGLFMLKKSPSPAPSEVVSQPETGTVVEEPTVVPAEGTVKEFTVEGSPFKFVPNVIKVKKGDTVRVTFKNVTGNHDFVIDEFEVQTNQIGEGEEEEVEFVADKVGTFEYYCSVGNHRG